VVAYLPERAISVGVPREIEIAVSAGVPVAVLRPGHTRTSWALQDVPIFIDASHIAVWLDSLPEVPHWPITFHVGPDGTIPSRAHEGDAGYDLYASESVEVPLGEFRDIPTDVRVALPSGVWARITGRSSTLRRRGLLAVEGVIDTGYRGKLFAAVYNLTEKTVVEKGERVAQLIPQVNLGSLEVAQAHTIREFQEIPAVDNRGSNGFGSTGS
jgi:dUTP pyrophosphatase